MAVCEVQKSPIHGSGVFATENIAAEITLFETHVLGPTDRWVNISPNCQYNTRRKIQTAGLRQGAGLNF